MLRRLKTGRTGTKVTAKILKVRRAQRLTTLITFIASRLVEATIGTDPLHIAVGQETLAFRAISLQHLILVDVPLIEQCQKHIVSSLSMIGSVGSGKKIEGDAQSPPAIHEVPVIFVCHLLRRSRFLFGTNRDRRPVLVATRNHQHIIAFQAMIAGEDIGR